ncbi:MAG: hypothetical protein HGB08_01370 [Candidatus Moranbacteria bacterium]|nr:hypothetical protein [Candidatus Moranbacteria bacterium]
MCLEKAFRNSLVLLSEKAIREGTLVTGGFLEIIEHPGFFISLEDDKSCPDEVGPHLVLIEIVETKKGRICVYHNLP